MSAPHALEPGTVLVDRYRLEEERGRSGGTTYWRASDELLDRAVAVCLLEDGGDEAARVLGAARRAAAVTDPRFLRVLDAAATDGFVYVVSEWVAATSLADLLADQVLPAAVARDLAVEVAGALDAAHGQGLAHLCLSPEHVLRTSHGTVKVAGLAVDAAVQGIAEDDPDRAAARDARGVAAILYAALTARWPGEEPSRVPPAPYDAGRLCSPRQVKAGVPDDLDVIAASVLDAGPRHHHQNDPPVRTPGDLGKALIATATTGRMPAIRPAADLPGDTPPPYPTGPYVATYDDEPPPRGRAGRAAYLLVGLVLVVGLALAGWQIANGGLGPVGRNDNAGDPTPSASSSAPATTRLLTIASATGFDPEGDGEENSGRAEQAVDGSRSTFWNTKTYKQQLGPGGLKSGVGLLLDLGSKQQIGKVTVRTNLDPTVLQVRTADDEGSALDDYDRVGRMATAGGTGTLTLSRQARFVLLWITDLPEGPDGFRTEISQVTVRG